MSAAANVAGTFVVEYGAAGTFDVQRTLPGTFSATHGVAGTFDVACALPGTFVVEYSATGAFYALLAARLYQNDGAAAWALASVADRAVMGYYGAFSGDNDQVYL